MSNQIQFQSFNFKDLPVRVIIDPTNEFWFSGKDVCDILGYANDTDALKKHCKPKGVAKRYSPTKSGNQELTFINEPNLYRLIIKSRKPEAEPFEAWVMEEVLPTIRKTGRYEVNQQLALPEPEQTFTFTFTEHALRRMLYVTYIAERERQLLEAICAPLNHLGSKYAPMAYGCATEYQRAIADFRKILLDITKDVKVDLFDEQWRRLRELRNSKHAQTLI